MYRRHAGAALAGAAVALLALVGCAPDGDTTPVPTAGQTTDEAPGSHDGTHDEAEHTSAPVPTAAANSQESAIAAAEAVVTAFARPGLPEEQWWAELLPLLSQRGAVAYEGTLPENIPVTAVTGPGAVIDASTEVIILVEVPTDAGDYIVTLTRADASQPWLAERIRPAEG